MPIQIYQCNDCQHEFTLSISADSIIGANVYCPNCCGANVTKKGISFDKIIKTIFSKIKK